MKALLFYLTIKLAPLICGSTSLYYEKSFSPMESSVEDKWCNKLAAACPYLRSNTARPAEDHWTPVNVSISFRSEKQIKIDGNAQQFSVRGYFVFSWQLPPCADWADGKQLSKKTTPVLMCVYDKKKIWRPPLRHTNGIDNSNIFDTFSEDVIVSLDGEAIWQVGGRFTAACSLSFKKYPYDVQKCWLDFAIQGSLFNSSYRLVNFTGLSVLNVTEPDENSPLSLPGGDRSATSLWKINRVTGFIKHGDKLSIEFLASRTNPSLYYGNVFLPASLLTVAQLAAFAMPAEMAQRAVFSMVAIMSRLILRSSLFADSKVPSSTSEFIYLDLFLTAQLTISVLVTIYVLVACRLSNVIERFFQPILIHGRKVALIDAIDFIAAFVSCLSFVGSYVFYCLAITWQ